jgi:carbon-monoxide dehydrogenase medium subunit
MINDFDFVQPRDLPEALNALSGSGRILPIAGGTNVLVNLKRAPLEADLLVDLSRLEALQSISMDNDVTRLGAGVTLARLLKWQPGGPVQRLMQPMCGEFAGPLVRNLATIGGNICDASPAADVSPVLLALGAWVNLESHSGGVRRMSLSDFFMGVRKTALENTELLTNITFTTPADDTRTFYFKLGKRKADAISIVSVAMAVKFTAGSVNKARIALGAVAPVVMRALQAEQVLEGGPLTENSIATAAAAAASEAHPIDDFRAGGDYRRQMVEVLVKRGLSEML